MNLWIGRVIAAIIATVAGFIQAKFDLVIDVEKTTEAVVQIIGVMLLVYGVAHKQVDKKMNPTDVAR